MEESIQLNESKSSKSKLDVTTGTNIIINTFLDTFLETTKEGLILAPTMASVVSIAELSKYKGEYIFPSNPQMEPYVYNPANTNVGESKRKNLSFNVFNNSTTIDPVYTPISTPKQTESEIKVPDDDIYKPLNYSTKTPEDVNMFARWFMDSVKDKRRDEMGVAQLVMYVLYGSYIGTNKTLSGLMGLFGNGETSTSASMSKTIGVFLSTLLIYSSLSNTLYENEKQLYGSSKNNNNREGSKNKKKQKKSKSNSSGDTTTESNDNSKIKDNMENMPPIIKRLFELFTSITTPYIFIFKLFTVICYVSILMSILSLSFSFSTVSSSGLALLNAIMVMIFIVVTGIGYMSQIITNIIRLSKKDNIQSFGDAFMSIIDVLFYSIINNLLDYIDIINSFISKKRIMSIMDMLTDDKGSSGDSTLSAFLLIFKIPAVLIILLLAFVGILMGIFFGLVPVVLSAILPIILSMWMGVTTLYKITFVGLKNINKLLCESPNGGAYKSIFSILSMFLILNVYSKMLRKNPQANGVGEKDKSKPTNDEETLYRSILGILAGLLFIIAGSIMFVKSSSCNV